PLYRRVRQSVRVLPPTRLSRDAPSFPTRRSSDLHALVDLSIKVTAHGHAIDGQQPRVDAHHRRGVAVGGNILGGNAPRGIGAARSEEHTSELQSRENLVCRLLLEKKKS